MSEPVPRYGVVGNPVAHSLSPRIHAAFARETGLAVDYRLLPAPLDGFVAVVDRFFADGGRGVNVTVPFKLEAYAACGGRSSTRARRAGAVNFVACDDGAWSGDNTDGDGLVVDLVRLRGDLADARLLLVGAGGAARGVIGPLLEARPRELVVVNRDRARADAVVATWAADGAPVSAVSFDGLAGASFDVIVNATSASLAGAALPLPPSVFAEAGLAYDMMYGPAPTAFMVAAGTGGARVVADGLGMLVEQAAESFYLWRGVRPATAPVLALLRESLRMQRTVG